MKRKLALLLAGVMTMTMLPMNLFAASTNKLSRTISAYQGGTVLVEEGVAGLGGGVTPETAEFGDVKRYVRGTDLVIQLSNPITSGDTLRLTLDNAEWFFRSELAETATVTSVQALAALNAVSGGAIAVKNVFPLAGNVAVSGSSVSVAGLTAIVAAGVPLKLDNFFVDGAVTDNSTDFLGAKPIGSTYNPAKGAYFTDKTVAANVTTAGGFAIADRDTGLNTATNANVMLMAGGYQGAYFRATTGGITTKTPYVLAVNKSNASIADVYITDDFPVGSEIRIPLAVRVKSDDKDASVAIQNASGYISAGVVPIFSATTGDTVASTAVKTGRNTIDLDPITFVETKTGTITNGTFTLEVADGYYFATTGGITVGFAGFPAGAMGTVTTTDAAGEISTLNVNLSGVLPSQGIPGRLDISGIKINNDDSDLYGDITVAIESTSADPGITDATLKVAERVNYGVNLAKKTAADSIPTIVTGRDTADDTTKVVTFKLAESAVNSWFSEQETKLSLPSGARWRKVEIDTTNVASTDTFATAAITADDSEVKFDGGDLILKGFGRKANEKATLEVKAWITVSQKLADTDITVSLTGGGMSEATAPAPLVVAKAIAPVTLAATTVSEIKVGLQAQPTSDIVITETTAGALQAGKYVQIKLTDLYGSIGYNDLVFAANTAKIAVAAPGNLKTADFKIGAGTVSSTAGGLLTGSSDEISFKVDKKSTVASTITISNVSVKASRILPETDKENYKVFVYGDAIAANYGKSGFKTLADAGVSTDYIKVGAGVGNLASAAAEFKYSIAEGTTEYVVNGKPYPLADDMKGYNKNGTIMVPIRLIAEGFGLDVHWNESNRTVIVDLSTTVKAEFPVGKTFMKVGGTQVDMLDVNDNAVATEITNEHAFVPFAQLGYALGISRTNMAWDQATQTVTFNPSK